MSPHTFRRTLWVLGGGFALAFAYLVLPTVIARPDAMWVLRAGFVNPIASGYAIDVIGCWLLLVVWVIHEHRTLRVRGGWIAVVLGAVPGVVTGLCAYLLLRGAQVPQIHGRLRLDEGAAREE